MHNATMKSPRLQAVYNALKQEPLTTKQLIQRTGMCAINTIVDEIRECGYKIPCKCIKKGVFLYTLEEEN